MLPHVRSWLYKYASTKLNQGKTSMPIAKGTQRILKLKISSLQCMHASFVYMHKNKSEVS